MSDYQYLEGFAALDILVDKVRESILSKFDAHPNEYDPRDVDTVKRQEWAVKRFVLDQKDVEAATHALHESLTWRKTVSIQDMNANHFPREFFDMGILALGEDREGLTVLYIRLKFYKKFSEWQEVFGKLVTFLLYRLDAQARDRQFGVVIDLAGAGLANCDMALMGVITSVLFRHLPLGAKYLWLYDASWIVRPMIGLLLSLVPEKYRNLVKNVSRKDGRELMGESLLPQFMGGSNRVTIDVPPDAPTIEQVAMRLGLGSAQGLRSHCDQVKGL